MPPPRIMGDGRKAKDPKKTFLRLLGYMKPYKARLIVMVVCIILATCATVASNGSLNILIEKYITPMLGTQTPNFGPLIGFLCVMAVIYLAGMLANFLAAWLMVPVAQGIQKNIRDLQTFLFRKTIPFKNLYTKFM